ncbi:MAG: ABC transporter permease [Spirochaetia bacterium]|jgi:peptide/nickel transport system permease protein
MRSFTGFIAGFKKRPAGLVGATIILLVVTLSILAPVITPYAPETPLTDDNRQPPSSKHIFGTDEIGMDIYTRIVWSARIDLGIGVLATLLSLLIGIPLGLMVGYFEGWLGEVIMRITDLVQAFPVFIFAMVLVAVLGNKIQNIVAAITFLNAPIYMRLVRTEVLTMKNRQFIEAAYCAGKTDLNIIFVELLPNCIRPALIQSSVNVGWAILLTAGISFIGAGIRVPTPEWGSMISLGADSIMTGQWWSSFFPGIAIMITVMGFALLGDYLRWYLNPEVH